MPEQTVDINENGATRLMAAIAGQEVRAFLEGKGDVELANKSLQLLLEIIAGAVPNVPTSDIKELAKPAHNTQSTAFLSREEFRNIAVKHGVDYNVAIGLYWDVKNAAHL